MDTIERLKELREKISTGQKDITDSMERLKRLRKKVGFKQKDIARMVGVSANTISRWENRKNKPHKVFAKKVEDILNFKPKRRGHIKSGSGKDNK